MFEDSLISGENFSITLVVENIGNNRHVSTPISSKLKHEIPITIPDVQVPHHLKETTSRLKDILLSMIGSDQTRKIVYYENVLTGLPVLVFYMKSYKYCNNIQRQHKNNNVYFVFHIKKKILFQKCMKCVSFAHKVSVDLSS